MTRKMQEIAQLYLFSVTKGFLMRKAQRCVCQEKSVKQSKERKHRLDFSDDQKEILDVASFASMMTWLW